MSDQETPSVWWQLPVRLTGWLLAANVAIFAWLTWKYGLGATENNFVLFAYGAKYNPAIDRGEWWRLVASNFLHSGWLHLTVNMYALVQMGLVCELLFGPGWFLGIYVLSGLGAQYLGYRGHDMLSVGASGPICGLGGALISLGFLGRDRLPGDLSARLRRGAVPFVVLNAMIGMGPWGIDNHAHGGGFVTGLVVGAMAVGLARAGRLYAVGGVAMGCVAVAVLAYGGVEAWRRVPEARVAIEITALFKPLRLVTEAGKSMTAELARLYPTERRVGPFDRARGMAARKALLEWIDARIAFRAAILGWPEAQDAAVRTALADWRARDPDLGPMRTRFARYADRSVEEDLERDQAQHFEEWKALMNPPWDKGMLALNERFLQVYPLPPKR